MVCFGFFMWFPLYLYACVFINVQIFIPNRSQFWFSPIVYGSQSSSVKTSPRSYFDQYLNATSLPHLHHFGKQRERNRETTTELLKVLILDQAYSPNKTAYEIYSTSSLTTVTLNYDCCLVVICLEGDIPEQQARQGLHK